MNVVDASIMLNKSLFRLKEKSPSGNLNPSDFSADIIINGAIALHDEINRKMAGDIDSSLSYKEKVDLRRFLTYPERMNVRKLSYCVEIVEVIGQATNHIIAGLHEEDIDYVKNQIYRLIELELSEETIATYYIEKHGFNPFNLDY